ncbi:MAG: hypothetical protein F4210_02255 [Holophagales bacterium]|nr:hypothetical protein [Holophagales bacterium]MYF94333.1 hypothetical protein [Holophagales bacterium]
MAESTGRSPWFYALLGCLGCLGIVVLVVGGLAFFGVRTAQQVTADNEDPERRRNRALEVLGAEREPGGYHAAAVVSIPLFLEMAVFSDRPAEDGVWEGEFSEEGFFYLRVRGGGDDLRAFFDGETSESVTFREMGLELDIDENLGRGDLDRGDFTGRWATFRGRTLYEAGIEVGERVTLIEFDCPDDEWMRMGVWFGPAIESGDQGAVTEPGPGPGGSAADGEVIEAFLEPIHPCGRSV